MKAGGRPPHEPLDLRRSNTFRTRIWPPALKARPASASTCAPTISATPMPPGCWLLAGGFDLKSVMDRMGHAKITTTQKCLHTVPDADTKNLFSCGPGIGRGG
jgi:integrase